MDPNHDKVIQSLLWPVIGYEPIWIEMSGKLASGQASEAILRSPASAHDGPQKVRDEAKKCPRFKRAWTLCQNRRPVLATNDLSPDVYVEWQSSLVR